MQWQHTKNHTKAYNSNDSHARRQ